MRSAFNFLLATRTVGTATVRNTFPCRPPCLSPKTSCSSNNLRNFIVAILIIIYGFVIVPPTAANDLIISRAVLEDKAGALTIADVAGREFNPIGPVLSKGFTNSAIWLRLNVRAPAKGSEAVLYIRQPFLNEIHLYEAVAGNPPIWKSRVTGNHYPYGARDRARKTLGFVVSVAAPETTYYLRIKTSSVVTVSVDALEPAEAEQKDNQLDLLELFFVTSMLLLLLWAIHSYLLDRLPVVGLFAIHQAAYTIYGVAVTGYLAPLIPVGFPRLADWATAIPYCAVSFTTLLFCRELFKPYQPPPLLMRGLDLSLLVFPIQLVAMFLGYTPFAVIINLVLIRITWWYFVVMVFTLRREQSPSRRSLQLFFVTITVIFSLFWFFGKSEYLSAKNQLLGRQILIANGLIIGGIFAMILNARSRRLLQEAQQSALELQAKSEFLSLVSHEIRTPLNALVGFSSLARTTKDPVKLDQYHAILEQSSRALMELVNGILDMSKIEAGRMELEAVPFNLRQLVAGLEEPYRHLADQKMLEFNVSVADDVPAWVIGDPLRLRQILANLLANAIKFTASGDVSFSVSSATPCGGQSHLLVRFAVRDTGIGIASNKRTLLFQPFRQLDPSISRTFGGSGLGLAIVRSLVEIMQGSITVDSREGAGSCFTVELPFRETEAAPDELLVTPVTVASLAVLVVEDNGFNRRLLGDILISWGQQVTLAEDGRKALELTEQQRFDLILLDIRMPGIDGIEVARRIRLREQELSITAVPIIAITADVDATTRQACLDSGINAVLAKPVIPEQLAGAMVAHCGDLPVSSGEPLQLNVQTCSDLGNNPERARQYSEMLLADIADELDFLQTSIERDDRNNFSRAAHSLKGLCGHLENREPAERAAWLQANAAQASKEELRVAVDHLQTICKACALNSRQ